MLEVGVLREEGRIPFRLRVGVTGHRDLAEPELVAASVRERLAEIRARFPATVTTPVVFAIRSSLAEGADRLVAREALVSLADAGVELHALLPLPADEYERDFGSRQSVAEFRELLAEASAQPEPPPFEDREAAYQYAGHAVVDGSDVVIALWDGRDGTGSAGTAETVSYARHQDVPLLIIPTKRADQSDPPARHTPAAAAHIRMPAAFEAWRRTSEFNEGSVHEPRLRKPLERMKRHLTSPIEDSATASQSRLLASWAAPLFVRADAPALRYQRWHHRLGAALYLLAAVAVIAVAAQSQAEWSSKFALVEVGAMLTLLIAYGIARHVGVHDRWLGYRSLAEAFRSAPFIAAVGGSTRQSTIEAPGPAEPWFQRAFSEAWNARPRIRPDAISAAELRRFVIEGWIDDQIAYHERAADRLEQGRSRITLAILALFGATVAVGILHVFEIAEHSFWPDVFVFLAVALPAVGAALTGIRDQRQFRIHQARSRRMANRLRQLRRQLGRESDLPAVQRLAAQAQTAIEADKQDWWGVTEFQDVEIMV